MNALLRWLALVLLASLGLQFFFVLHIATLAWLDAPSTSFQRTQMWTQWQRTGTLRWQHTWQPYAHISEHLKRAVVAAEDDGFVQHQGVEWEAIERARQRNAQAAQKALRAPERHPQRSHAAPATVRGGSTITQQLAKNLLLSGERTLVRKGQELALTWLLEHFLDKRRILELYLNSVEWGTGIFGAQAAALHYFGKPAADLSAPEAARLAVMLPAPQRFEKTPDAPYLAARAKALAARMGHSRIP